MALQTANRCTGLLITAGWLFFFSTFAQIPSHLPEPRFVTYTLSDGLSDNQVTCILKDKRGFIWIGTRNGLNRFDGRAFKTFHADPEKKNTLIGNHITCLETDGDSIMWIGTASSGICSFNIYTETFAQYDRRNLPLLSNSVNKIRFDSIRKCLWIALNNFGLQQVMLPDLKNVRTLSSGNSYYDVALMDTLVLTAGITESLINVNQAGKKRSLPDMSAHTLNCITITKDGSIWAGAWDNGLHRFNKQSQKEFSCLLNNDNQLRYSDDEILCLAEDDNMTLWCGTKYSGLHFFSLTQQRFIQKFSHPPIPALRINCIYKDSRGLIWIGSDAGIYLYNPFYHQFDITMLPAPKGSGNCMVYDRIISRGKTEYVIAECGLFVKKNSDTYQFFPLKYNNRALRGYSIFMDEHQHVLIGTNQSVFLLDTLTFQLNPIPLSKPVMNHWFSDVPSSRANNIISFSHHNDTVLLTSFYGHNCFLIDLKKHNLMMLTQGPGIEYRFIENLIKIIRVDSRNNIWICGASRGITRLHLNDLPAASAFGYRLDSVPQLVVGNDSWYDISKNSLSRINSVNDILERSDGSYLISTQENGLLFFNPDNNSMPFIPVKNGQFASRGLAFDKDSMLWIIGVDGIYRMDLITNATNHFGKQFGISSNLSGYFFTVANNRLTTGFNSGFISFDPLTVQTDTLLPAPEITSLWVMDTPSDSLLHAPLKLKYRNNYLKFYISSKVYTDNEALTYHYQLVELDNGWRDNGNNPYLIYTNLPHGNFKLAFKIRTDSGRESNVQYFQFSITPPFYKTPVFFFLATATFLSLFYGIYRYRLKQVLRLQEVRNNIARDLHDDIGSTLGSIHLYSQIARSKTENNATELMEILQRIEHSSAEIIEKAGDTVWTVNASNDSVLKLAARMESYAYTVLSVTGITLHFHYDLNMADTPLDMIRRKNVFFIFKEIIHNIQKYSKCHHVDVSVHRTGDEIIIEVSDDGVGFIPENVNKGNGLRNMQWRASEIKGRLSIKSTPGSGTAIRLSFRN